MRKPDFTTRLAGERETLEIYGWPLPDDKEEREFTCDGCGGDGCVQCGETGVYCTEVKPVTLEDMETLPAGSVKES